MAEPAAIAEFESDNVARYEFVRTVLPFTLPSRCRRFTSLAHLMRSVRQSGNRFFTTGAMRVFAIDSADVTTTFFITSQSSRTHPQERDYRVWYVSSAPGESLLTVNPLKPVLDNLRMARLLAADARRICG